MVPPWASTICFEMFKPNPEWVPSFSPAGRLTPEAPGPVCNSCESVHGKGSKAGPRVPYQPVEKGAIDRVSLDGET